MSKFAINPNAMPDIAAEQAAALDRDRAAIHHFDDDGAGNAAEADADPRLPPRMLMPDPRYRHGDVDKIEARLATREAAPAKAAPVPPPKPDDSGARHPLVEGLLASLPAPGAVWSAADRADWLRAAECIFHLVYEADAQVKVEPEAA